MKRKGNRKTPKCKHVERKEKYTESEDSEEYDMNKGHGNFYDDSSENENETDKSSKKKKQEKRKYDMDNSFIKRKRNIEGHDMESKKRRKRDDEEKRKEEGKEVNIESNHDNENKKGERENV